MWCGCLPFGFFVGQKALIFNENQSILCGLLRYRVCLEVNNVYVKKSSVLFCMRVCVQCQRVVLNKNFPL